LPRAAFSLLSSLATFLSLITFMGSWAVTNSWQW
jgi:hypothetical protein